MVDRLSDHVLVHNAALGDADAFEQIVARYGPEMFRYARNMLSDHGAAEEVVQDAFVAAWKGLDTFRGDAKLRTWLFSMVSHKVVDHRRRRAVPPAEDWIFEQRSTDAHLDPEKRATNDDFLDALGRVLAELPYRQRACWLLREVEGMTHPEIGQIMGMSAGAVRGQLLRARATLSERLAAWQ